MLPFFYYKRYSHSQREHIIQGNTKLPRYIKKLLIFFFPFPVLSGKFGNQSLKVPRNKNFLFLSLLAFLYQNQNPGFIMSPGRQSCACMFIINR